MRRVWGAFLAVVLSCWNVPARADEPAFVALGVPVRRVEFDDGWHVHGETLPADEAHALGPTRGVTFVLGPLALVRIRCVEPQPCRPRAVRLVEASIDANPDAEPTPSSELALMEEDPLTLASGEWVLASPLFTQSTWIITSDVDAHVFVEAPHARESRLAWEDTLHRAISTEASALTTEGWVPELRPEIDAVDAMMEPLRGRLQAPAWLALQRVQVLLRIARLRPFDIAIHSVSVPSAWTSQTTELGTRRLVRADHDVAFEVQGEGVLALDASATSEGGDRTLVVLQDGIERERFVLPAPRQPAHPSRFFPASPHRAGPTLRLRVPTLGRHRFVVRVEGGDASMTLRLERRRPRISQRPDGETELATHVRLARESLGDDAVAHLVLGMLDALDGTSTRCTEGDARALGDDRLALACALSSIGFSPGDLARYVDALLDAGPLDAWSRELALRALMVVAASDPAFVTQALSRAQDADLAAAVALRRPALLPQDAERWLHQARDADPLHAGYRQALLALRRAHRAQAWRNLAPHADGAREVECLAPHLSTQGAHPQGIGDLVALTREPIDIRIPESPYALERAGVLRVEVASTGPARGALRVDGTLYEAVHLGGLASWRLALTPGVHHLAWEGDAQAFVASAITALRPNTVRRRYVEVAPESAPVTFDIEHTTRLEVRGAGAMRGTLRISFDEGTVRTLQLNALVDDQALAEEPLSHAFVVDLEAPRGARTMHVLSDSGTWLIAARAVQARAPSAGPTAPATAQATPRDVRERATFIAQATRTLRSDPSDHTTRIARAHAFLDVMRIDLARDDLAVLSREAAELPATALLQARADAYDAPSIADAHVEREGLACVPGALGIHAPVSDAALASASGAPPPLSDLQARAAHADLLAHRGETSEAAARWLEVYRETRAWSAGARAAELFAEASRNHGAHAWALVYGLAAELVEAHPMRSVRALLAEAAEHTEWMHVGADASAGYERIETSEVETLEDAELLARARVAAPWPLDEGELLRAGTRIRVIVALAQASTLSLEIACGDATSSDETPCRFTRYLDGGTPETQTLGRGQQATLALGRQRQGEHRIDLDFDGDVGLVRILSDGISAPTHRIQMHTATPSMPARFAVLGPTTALVVARGLDASATRLDVDVSGSSTHTEAQLPLDPTPSSARALPARAWACSRASSTLVPVLQAGPTTLSMRPADGAALVELFMRVERTAEPAEAETLATTPTISVPQEHAEVAPLRLPALMLPTPMGDFGTLSATARAYQNDTSETDQLARPSSLFGLAVTHRLELVPHSLWISTNLEARLRLEIGPAFGLSVALYAGRLPLGFRFSFMAEADVSIEPFGWALHARAHAERPFQIDPDVVLTPSLGVVAHGQSLAHMPAVGPVDFEVYSLFRENHALTLFPSLDLHWLIAQDARLDLGLTGWTNAEVISFDRASLTFGGTVEADIGSPLIMRVVYRPGLRFQDANRAATYARHDITLLARWAPWWGRDGRFVVTLQGQAFVSDQGTDFLGLLSIGTDFTFGRGLRDFQPPEIFFPTLQSEERFRMSTP